MRRIEGDGGTALLSGNTLGERGAAAKLVDLTRNLAGMVADDLRFMAQPVAADDIDPALEDQPGGDVALAQCKHRVAGLEMPGLARGEAARDFDLRRGQGREHLLPAPGQVRFGEIGLGGSHQFTRCAWRIRILGASIWPFITPSPALGSVGESMILWTTSMPSSTWPKTAKP